MIILKRWCQVDEFDTLPRDDPTPTFQSIQYLSWSVPLSQRPILDNSLDNSPEPWTLVRGSRDKQKSFTVYRPWDAQRGCRMTAYFFFWKLRIMMKATGAWYFAQGSSIGLRLGYFNYEIHRKNSAGEWTNRIANNLPLDPFTLSLVKLVCVGLDSHRHFYFHC